MNNLKVGYNQLDEDSAALIELMLEGDPNCEIPLGATCVKTFGDEGDYHPVGSKGKVVGSLKVGDNEAYLVMFGDDEVPTFIIKEKIKEYVEE